MPTDQPNGLGEFLDDEVWPNDFSESTLRPFGGCSQFLEIKDVENAQASVSESSFESLKLTEEASIPGFLKGKVEINNSKSYVLTLYVDKVQRVQIRDSAKFEECCQKTENRGKCRRYFIGAYLLGTGTISTGETKQNGSEASVQVKLSPQYSVGFNHQHENVSNDESKVAFEEKYFAFLPVESGVKPPVRHFEPKAFSLSFFVPGLGQLTTNYGAKVRDKREKAKGAAFLVSEILLGSAVASGFAYSKYSDSQISTTRGDDADMWRNKADSFRIMGIVSAAVLGIVHLANVLDAGIESRPPAWR